MKILSNIKSAVGTANPMLYGHFLEHFHRQVYGGIYDPTSRFADEDGFREDVIEALKKIKTPIIRWPGGCFVSDYNWKYGVGKERQGTYNKAWRVEEPNTFGTDEFVKFCRKVGCEPYICTNAGTGRDVDMSDWVEYCNLPKEGIWAKQRIANGFTEPHNVKYWSIGNENWGGHEIGAKDRTTWGLLVREAAKQMIKVDPALELSAASIADLDWNLNLLKEAGYYLNWISIHGYWEGTADGLSREKYDKVIGKTGASLADGIDKVRAYLTAFGLQDKIKIAFDEWNLRGWFHPYSLDNGRGEAYKAVDFLPYRDRNDTNSFYTMADAVFSAAFLNTCLRNCDLVGMACFSPAVNTVGAIFTHKDGIVLRPTYYVFELYANLMKANVLNSWAWDVPKLGGDEKNNLIDVVVTYGEGSFAVSAVNKDAVNVQTIELDMTDTPVSEYRLHTLNGSDRDAYNDIGKTDVSIKVSAWMKFEGSVALEPHSVNIIELK